MISINSCGHDSHHPKPCNIEHKNGVLDYLILLIKQTSWVILEGRRRLLEPNTVMCFPPDTYIHYGCDETGYNDDWIHFTLDEKEQSLISELDILLCQILYPNDFHKLSEYVRLLSDSFHSPSTYTEQIADSFMHIILYTLCEELKNNTESPLNKKYHRDFSKLRTQIYNNPAAPWKVPSLASSLCLSISYFQHLYKQYFSCSCQQDIINARLKSARYYLKNSNMKIREIADFCGYENELHFMRQFKKFAGMTPTKYRKQATCNSAENRS